MSGRDPVIVLCARRLGAIRQRCNNPNTKGYQYYGGRGIKCRITLDELETAYHRDRANQFDRPSVDRLDNDGDYCFGNIRWIEWIENRPETFKGKKLTEALRRGK